MSRTILFVDDEANVLEGLRRSLRRARAGWELRFAESGRAALSTLAAETVDVLVSDVRMPGMDGLELLTRARDEFPEAVRVALTGECNRETMLQLAVIAHRTFTKPCDTGALLGAIQRVCQYREALRSPPLLQLLGRLSCLPTPSPLFARLVAELQRPDATIRALGDLVADDPALTAKLLHLANSSLLSLRRPAVTAADAVQALGLQLTRAVLMMSEVSRRYDGRALHPHSLDHIWEHSRRVAGLAAAIAHREYGPGAVAAARLAGLLHDVGRLVLATAEPAAYRDVLAAGPLVEAERAAFGAHHAHVGGYVLGLWGLPDAVVEAVTTHHTPLAAAGGGPPPVAAAEWVCGGDEGGLDEFFVSAGLAHRRAEWARLAEAAP